MSKTIWLIRHGESAANAGLATETPESIPLTEKGFRQAQLLADYFPETPSLIIVSPYLRAEQTAAPLINRFSSLSVQKWVVHEFTYLSLERCGHSTMAMRKPLVDEFWNRSDADYCDGDGAESFAGFIYRVRETTEKLKAAEYQSIAVFTHAQFIRALMWIILTGNREINSKSMKEFYYFLLAVSFPNTAFVKINLSEFEAYVSNIISEHLEPGLISF